MNARNMACALGVLLALGCTARPDDSQIARDVERNLGSDMALSGARIEVASVDGVVTLAGNVTSASESSRAEQIAEQVEGVVRVRNQLSVTPPPVASPPPPPADAPPPSDTAPAPPADAAPQEAGPRPEPESETDVETEEPEAAPDSEGMDEARDAPPPG
jgi:outer membrane biosynthesis protein TonB